MSKTWHTKKKILKLVSKKAKTPGEISEELGLAPSTVSEHLEALEGMGAITPVENQFVKKWKYFRANPDFNIQSRSELNRASSIPQIVGTLVVVLGLLGLIAFGLPALSAGKSGNQVFFSLTDPPSVPSGTQSLNITYSSLQAHYVGAENVSGWVSGTGSGALDLMSLINTSEVIGSGVVPANTTIDMVRFSITSAHITINSTVYNVTVPNGQLAAKVTGKTITNSSILIDLSPVVASIFTQNSTVFVLVPSVKAVMIGNAIIGAHVGERHVLTNAEHGVLNKTVDEINITSASLVVTNNSTTTLMVSVKNNGNKTIDLRNVVLSGMPSVMVREGGNFSVGENGIEANIEARPDFLRLNGPEDALLNISNSSEQGSMQGNMVAGMERGIHFEEVGAAMINGVHVGIVGRENESMPMPFLSGKETADLNNLVRVGAQARMLGVLNFIVTSNGTLVLPFVGGGCSCSGGGNRACPDIVPCIMGEPGVGIFNGTGFELKAGATATLIYSGSMLYANDHLRITPVIGSKYKLVVMGERDAHAQTNVTAVSD
jgi:DNA-binding transcriptional ArsR family regulator